MFRSELEALARADGRRIIWLVGSSREPGDSITADTLRHLDPKLTEHDVYLWASRAMPSAVRAGLRETGVPARQLHEEVFFL